MNSAVKNILKIFAVGLAATVVRIIGQLSIPSGEQTVLPPSVFAKTERCRWPSLSMGYLLTP